MYSEMFQRTADGDYTAVAWFDDFFGENRFAALSNFYVGEPLLIPEFSNDPFMTGEHAFAAMKTKDVEWFKRIQNAGDPDTAKAFGRQCPLRKNWEEVKLDVMMAVLRTKFTLEREEGDILLSTGHALLLEGTFWGDKVWGIDLDRSNSPYSAPGRNWLGTLLMARRAELFAEKTYRVYHGTDVHNAMFARK